MKELEPVRLYECPICGTKYQAFKRMWVVRHIKKVHGLKEKSE